MTPEKKSAPMPRMARRALSNRSFVNEQETVYRTPDEALEAYEREALRMELLEWRRL